MDAHLFEIERTKSPRRRPAPGPAELDLFSQAAADEHEPEIGLLIPIAQRLAREAGAEGVTVADVREEASRRGILPPLGEGRSLSYLGALMKRAGLVSTDRVRRSHIEGSNANRHTVWILPEFRPHRQGSAA